jgi:hypothetical protein
MFPANHFSTICTILTKEDEKRKMENGRWEREALKFKIFLIF